MSAYSRRLPIYLLLDCSESMAGEAIAELERGVEMMVSVLRDDPLALETAWASVITFAREARQVVPLTEILQFKCPHLSVRTGTALGGALRLLTDCLRREVVKTTETTRGDYKPLVFLFTDGQPTDAWEAAADAIRRRDGLTMAQVTAIACGADVDTEALYRITDVVVQMKDTTPQTWRKVFLWLSSSVKSASIAPVAGGLIEGPASGLPGQGPLGSFPVDALEIARHEPGPRDKTPRQVFLHAICSRNGRPYLMRYARKFESSTYTAVSSHPLETIEEDGGQELPPINTSQLEGCPGCPYCENSGVVHCDCQTLFCSDMTPGSIVECPTCKQQGKLGGGSGGGSESSGFEMRRSSG